MHEVVFGDALSTDEKYLRVAGKITRERFFSLLKDEAGVLREEYEAAMRLGPKEIKKLIPHEIFYLPKNLDEAFSPTMVKSRDNRISYWDIGGQRGGPMDWHTAWKLPSGETAALNEMFLVKAIYGDLRGYRDEKGILNIFDKNLREFVPISGERLARLIGRTMGLLKDGKSLNSPVEYVAKNCQELVSRGLLLPRDFGGNFNWRKDVGRQISFVNQMGRVGVGGHYFYVRNVIDNERVQDFGAVQLSQDEYAVVENMPDGRWEVVATRRFSSDDYCEGKSGSFSRYQITRENHQLPGESATDYAERIRRMSDYSFVAQVVAEIAGQTEIPIKGYLTWREQQWLASTLYAHPDLKGPIIEATKVFGTDLLRTFLSCEYDIDNSEKILTLTEKLKKGEAERLFEKYGEIVQMVEDLENNLTVVTEREIEPEKRREIRENILRRAKNLLVEFAEGKNKSAEGNILQRIEAVQADAIVFGTTFKTLFKENPNIDIREMRGLGLQRTSLTQLSDKDKSEMVEIAKRNWLARAEGKDVVENFVKVLQSNRQIDFYVLRRDGKIISFLRFDEADADGKRHAASFNVDPKYGGSAIGEMMVRTVLVAETEKSIVELSVFPYQEKAPEYVEEIGFNITGILHGEKPGTEELVMTCEREKNNQFVSRSSKKEILMSLVVSDSARNWREMIGHNVIVLKFNPTKERTDLIGAAEGLIKEGYVGTRHFTDPQNKSERYYVFEFDRSKVRADEIAHDEIRQAANG